MLPNWLYGKSLKKLQEIFSDGSTPPDYNEVKAQVTQNTEGIALLNNTVEGKVNWSDYAQSGAVNLLPTTIGTQTTNGITFTVNSDGRITCNGTASANAELTLINGSPFIKKGTYTLSGCPSGGGSKTYRLFAKEYDSATYYNDDGDGAEVVTNNGLVYVRILISSGQTVNNLTFKPMITVPSYKGPYVPPAKTNKELTDELTVGALSATANTDYLNGTNNAIFRKYGKMVSCEGYFQVTTAAARAAVLYTLAELPLGSSFLLALKNTGNYVLLNAKSDGTIIVESEGGIAAGFYSLVGTFVLT